MKRQVVMFDIDGVLADFTEAYRRVQWALGQPITLTDRWDDYWDKDVWAVIRDSTDFYRTMPAIPPRETFERINDMRYGHDLYFVTARRGRDAHAQTSLWLQYQGIFRPTVVLSPKKGEMARALRADFAIDDKAGNAVFTSYFSEETRSFLLDSPFNQFDQSVLGTKVTRVASVDEFLDEVCR